MKRLAFVITLIITAFYSFAQWELQNPLPTGNSIKDVFFIDTLNGWAVCEYADYYDYQDIIIHTHDGGATWESQYCDTEQDLKSVHFYDENNGLAVGTGGVIVKTTNGGQTWNTCNSNTLVNLNAVQFTSEQKGFVVGDSGTILNTNDGGATWLITKVDSLDLYYLDFISVEEGWVVGHGSKIYHTSNGGDSWELINNERHWDYLTSVDFKNSDTGWLTDCQILDYGWFTVPVTLIMKSTDGGISWANQDTCWYYWLKSISFVDINHGRAVCDQLIYYTNNGGDLWESTLIGGLGDYFNSISVIDNDHMWASSSNKIIYSDNGTFNWQTKLDIIRSPMKSVYFLDSDEGWAVGNGIWHTINGGEIWEIDTSILGGISIYFVDDQNGWVVGQRGKIYQTNNGGENWLLQQFDQTKELRSVYFTDINNGWAVGGENTWATGKDKLVGSIILHTSDGGSSWHYQTADVWGINSVFFIDQDNGWAAGSGGLVLSTIDGGETWASQYIDDNDYALRSIHFTNQLNGWTVGDNGTIYHTQDGGATWIKNQSNTGNALNSVFFTDLNNGWIAGGDNYHPAIIYQTDDGGDTWDIDTSGIGRWFNSIYFTDSDNGWAVGFGGIIMHIDNGSMVGTNEVCPAISKRLAVNIRPNPFTTSTTISYELNHPSEVTIHIYNQFGKLVEVIEQHQQAGKQQITWNAEGLPAGIYYFRLDAGDQVASGKVVLVR